MPNSSVKPTYKNVAISPIFLSVSRCADTLVARQCLYLIYIIALLHLSLSVFFIISQIFSSLKILSVSASRSLALFKFSSPDIYDVYPWFV